MKGFFNPAFQQTIPVQFFKQGDDFHHPKGRSLHKFQQIEGGKIMETVQHAEPKTVNDTRKKIAELNDQFRMTGVGGKIVLTQGVANLGEDMVIKIILALRGFADWGQENDPWGEHDFGVIKLAEARKVYFKIDYYDTRMEYGSDDPSDPEKTIRVLTLMLPEEY